MEKPTGRRDWYVAGVRHREDGPAVELPNGTRKWYQGGALHRPKGPAVEFPDGTRVWYRGGQRHRDGGPAVEAYGGHTQWHRNGRPHREDGPAIESPAGTRYWYREGRLHRENGPAVERAGGQGEWWWRGEFLRYDPPRDYDAIALDEAGYIGDDDCSDEWLGEDFEWDECLDIYYYPLWYGPEFDHPFDEAWCLGDDDDCWDDDAQYYDAIALDPPDYACEFGCDDALVAG